MDFEQFDPIPANPSLPEEGSCDEADCNPVFFVGCTGNTSFGLNENDGVFETAPSSPLFTEDCQMRMEDFDIVSCKTVAYKRCASTGARVGKGGVDANGFAAPRKLAKLESSSDLISFDDFKGEDVVTFGMAFNLILHFLTKTFRQSLNLQYVWNH
eukprot:1446579-Rhodomonas_salina.1